MQKTLLIFDDKTLRKLLDGSSISIDRCGDALYVLNVLNALDSSHPEIETALMQ